VWGDVSDEASCPQIPTEFAQKGAGSNNKSTLASTLLQQSQDVTKTISTTKKQTQKKVLVLVQFGVIWN
jgi:hypothetical protein